MSTNRKSTIPGTLETNSVILINTLNEKEHGPVRRLIEDIEPLAQQSGWPLKHYKVSSPDSLRSLLEEISTQAMTESLKPVIHIEGHASKDLGLELGTGMISWTDLNEALRAVNENTHNNLMVVIAACEAYFAVRNITLLKKTPFYVFLAPTTEVKTGELEQQFRNFYKELIESHDIVKAKAKLGDSFHYFNAERILSLAILGYLRDHDGRSARKRRREGIVSQIVDVEGPGALKQARSHVKNVLRPIEDAHLVLLAQKFLFNREMGLTISDLKEMAQRERTLSCGK